MNHYCYNEIKNGHEEKFEVEIKPEMLDEFANITKDTNPLHIDSVFAKSKGYKERICYGMLTASFISTLAGVYIPGENSLIHSVEVKFVKPVYVGDKLTIIGTVIDKNDLFSCITLKITILNQKNEKVLRGKMQIGVLE